MHNNNRKEMNRKTERIFGYVSKTTVEMMLMTSKGKKCLERINILAHENGPIKIHIRNAIACLYGIRDNISLLRYTALFFLLYSFGRPL